MEATFKYLASHILFYLLFKQQTKIQSKPLNKYNQMFRYALKSLERSGVYFNIKSPITQGTSISWLNSLIRPNTE